MIQNENDTVSERGSLDDAPVNSDSLPKSIADRITLGCNETMAGTAFCFICGHEVNQLGFDFFVHQDDVWVRDSQVCHSCARRLRPDLTMMQREAFEFLLNRQGKNIDDIWDEIKRTQARMPWEDRGEVPTQDEKLPAEAPAHEETKQDRLNHADEFVKNLVLQEIKNRRGTVEMPWTDAMDKKLAAIRKLELYYDAYFKGRFGDM